MVSLSVADQQQSPVASSEGSESSHASVWVVIWWVGRSCSGDDSCPDYLVHILRAGDHFD